MFKFRKGCALIALLALSALCFALIVHAVGGSENAVWPDPLGEKVQSDGKLIVDYSQRELGYVMVRVSQQTSHGLKLRVNYGNASLPDSDPNKYAQLTYNIDNTGLYETIPLPLGSGYYEFQLYENVKGNKYSAEGKVAMTVQLVDENAAFLVANQYVSYMKSSLTVQKSDELCAGKSAADTYKTICEFMSKEFAYDFVRALTIKAGTLPEVDPCFERRMGICQDLSAVMVCMLRVQGIPAKLVIGYADKNYHAWTVAIVDGEERFFDPTAAVGALGASNYTVERMY